MLGVKIGWVEGLEINLLSLIAGLDLRQPALKLPGFGRIDLTANAVTKDAAFDRLVFEKEQPSSARE
jgi:hypothetical protein